ncbi:MAG TPA: GAF domain-containing protein, partial [Rubrivivax sp.]|nr:GAF domain-containing protein [Rubrivivax sp.]
EHLRLPSSLADPFKRLVDSGLRLNQLRSEAALHDFLIDEVTELSGAERVLLVLQGAGTRRIAGSLLPAGEDAAALLQAVTPWLDEAASMQEPRLRHGPEGAAPEDQRSCLVAPLVAQGELLGHVYADIEGAFGRFVETDRDLLAMLAGQAAVALANLRFATGLEAQVDERTTEARAAQEQAEQRAGELAVINSVQLGMAARLDFQAIVDLVGDKLREVFDTGDIGIRILDGSRSQMLAPYFYSRGVRHDAPAMPVAKLRPGGPVDRVMHGETLVAHNRAEQAALGVRPVPGIEQSRSFVTVPIKAGEDVLGGMTLEHMDRDNAFGPSEVHLLQTVASSMGVAMENARLFNATQEALARQTATAEILHGISNSPTDAAPVFDAVAERARLLCGALVGFTSLADGDVLHLVGFRGVSSEGEAAMRAVFPVKKGAGSINGRCFQAAAPVQIADVGLAPGYQLNHVAKVVGYRSALAVPVLEGGQVIGTIGVLREQAGEFPAPMVSLLQTFADQAAIAIRNARLFNETQEALAHQTASANILSVINGSPTDVAPVFDVIARHAGVLCGARMVTTARFDGELLHLVGFYGTSPQAEAAMRAAFPLKPGGGSINALALAAGSPAQIPDVLLDPNYRLRDVAVLAGYRSLLAVPMLRNGQPIGVIGVGRDEPGAFPQRTIALLQSFADQAVIAIQNTTLFNETQEALAHQTASADILRVISSSPTDVQPVFEAIVGSGRRLLNCALATVLRTDGKTFQQVAMERGDGSGMSSVGRRRPVDPGHDFPSQVIVSKTAQHLPDWSAIELPAHEAEVFAQIGCRASLMLPLLRAGACIGVLALLRVEAGPFSEQEMALARSFCDHAVIAIENARLFNETQEALSHQTASADILRVISSSPTDVQPVFEAIVGTAVKHLGCDLALVQTVSGDTYSPKAMATPAGLLPVPGAQVIPVDPDANFPSRAIVAKTMLHVSDWSAVELPPHEQLRHEQLGLNSALYLPLLRGDDCVGVLVLGSRKANAFHHKAITLAESFRDQALIAIENTRLFNETQEALERQTATADILRIISGTPTDVTPVFDAIAERARVLCGGDIGATTRLEGDMLHLVGYHGTSPQAEAIMRESFPRKLDLSNSSSGRCIQSKAPVKIADILLDPAYQLTRVQYRSLLAVPMLQGGEAIGAIVVTRLEAGEIPDKWVGLLQAFADQAVIAIQNVRLFNETQEALERQTATAEILAVISESPTDVQPVFQAIAERARTLCRADVGATTRLDGDVVHLAGVRALSTQAEDAMRAGFPMALDAAPPNIRRAIVEQQPIQIADVHTEPGYPSAEVAQRSGFRSILSVPLLLKGHSIGTIGVARREPGRFADSAVTLLQTFSRQAVIAIENARLFRETQEALEHQTATSEVLNVIAASVDDAQPVFDKIIDSAAQLFPNALALMILQVDAQDMLHVAGIRFVGDASGPFSPEAARQRERAIAQAFPSPLAGTATELAIRTGLADIPDMQNATEVPGLQRFAKIIGFNFAALFAPLMWEGKGIGSIAMLSSRLGPFGDRERALIKTFADQAVIAIQNARLFRETNEALERQTATAEILKVIASSPSDVQPVFDAIARSSNQLLGGWSTMVARIHDDALHLVAFTSTTPEGDAALRRSFPIALETFPVGAAIRRGETVPIVDTECVDEGLQLVRELARARGYRSMLFCPLVREGQSVGMISVTRRETGPFAPHQVALLQTFADQAVIAIENVRLFNETKEALEQQQASADVLSVISSSVADTAPVFERILDSCERLFVTDQVAICMVHVDAQVHARAVRGAAIQTMMSVLPQPIDQTATGRAFRQRGAVHIADAAGEPNLPQTIRDAVARLGNYSCVFAPMLWEQQGIGSICVMRQPPVAFTAKEIALLATFADQAVIAIQNARLFNETKEALEQQTASAEVLTVIGSSVSDAAPVFERILDSGRRILNTNYVNIGLIGDDGLVHVDVNRAAQFPGDPMYPKVVAWLHATYPAP